MPVTKDKLTLLHTFDARRHEKPRALCSSFIVGGLHLFTDLRHTHRVPGGRLEESDCHLVLLHGGRATLHERFAVTKGEGLA